MLANLTDLVTGLTAQQAVILRQTQPVCPMAAVPAPPPPVAGAPAPAPPAAEISAQTSGSSRPPRRPFRR
ncbi:hypothetical protein AXF42_Ash021212 [Apostasia shenzhenica]|uniref:Uncharacterized protein n=1 Tax=Apostasia shenzhenica TaxID=1088818 RepID=A0A2H9ZYH0_9ASPA|nr:hypothetical protein AXF42_Ash021212 [Apostasia shenzhenica]